MPVNIIGAINENLENRVAPGMNFSFIIQEVAVWRGSGNLSLNLAGNPLADQCWQAPDITEKLTSISGADY